MVLVKNNKRVDFFPESKEERKLIMALWDELKGSYPDVIFEFENDSEAMNLSILI